MVGMPANSSSFYSLSGENKKINKIPLYLDFLAHKVRTAKLQTILLILKLNVACSNTWIGPLHNKVEQL